MRRLIHELQTRHEAASVLRDMNDARDGDNFRARESDPDLITDGERITQHNREARRADVPAHHQAAVDLHGFAVFNTPARPAIRAFNKDQLLDSL